MKKWIIAALAFSLIPVWRDPAWQGGKNAWQAIWQISRSRQKTHLPIDEAIAEVKAAYQESAKVG